jgi:hypothetical protein
MVVSITFLWTEQLDDRRYLNRRTLDVGCVITGGTYAGGRSIGPLSVASVKFHASGSWLRNRLAYTLWSSYYILLNRFITAFTKATFPRTIARLIHFISARTVPLAFTSTWSSQYLTFLQQSLRKVFLLHSLIIKFFSSFFTLPTWPVVTTPTHAKITHLQNQAGFAYNRSK